MALSKKHQDAAAAAELERKRAEKQDKLCKIKSSLTADQMRTYRQHFELFDLNGDGVINARELRKVSRQMGYRLDDSQIEVYRPFSRVLLSANGATVGLSYQGQYLLACAVIRAKVTTAGHQAYAAA